MRFLIIVFIRLREQEHNKIEIPPMPMVLGLAVFLGCGQPREQKKAPWFRCAGHSDEPQDNRLCQQWLPQSV